MEIFNFFQSEKPTQFLVLVLSYIGATTVFGVGDGEKLDFNS